MLLQCKSFAAWMASPRRKRRCAACISGAFKTKESRGPTEGGERRERKRKVTPEGSWRSPPLLAAPNRLGRWQKGAAERLVRLMETLEAKVPKIPSALSSGGCACQTPLVRGWKGAMVSVWGGKLFSSTKTGKDASNWALGPLTPPGRREGGLGQRVPPERLSFPFAEPRGEFSWDGWGLLLSSGVSGPWWHQRSLRPSGEPCGSATWCWRGGGGF